EADRQRQVSLSGDRKSDGPVRVSDSSDLAGGELPLRSGFRRFAGHADPGGTDGRRELLGPEAGLREAGRGEASRRTGELVWPLLEARGQGGCEGEGGSGPGKGRLIGIGDRA